MKPRFVTVLATLAAVCSLACIGAAGASAAGLVAPPGTCPETPGGAASEEATMLCLTNYARAQAGEVALEPAVALQDSAAEKAEDIINCDSFSHFACGRDFTYWMRASGYIGDQCWRAGENLAWGSGEYGSVRSIFRAWMSSPTHRRNILGDYDEVGIGLVAGAVEGHDAARVWASHFGSHC